MRLRPVIVGFVVALALSATAGYAVQEFTLDEARTRIERLEARVASLEATIAVGNSATPEASEMHTVTGIVVIESSSYWGREGHGPVEVGAPCVGDAGFDDIRAGADVRALDGVGNVVGLGRLNPGVLGERGNLGLPCQFTWTMEVGDTEFYALEIANREGPSFSRAELEALGWNVELSIGS